MDLKFFKSKWEAEHLPLEESLEEVREAGFDGTEIYLPEIEETPEEIATLHGEYDLLLISQRPSARRRRSGTSRRSPTPGRSTSSFSSTCARRSKAEMD